MIPRDYTLEEQDRLISLRPSEGSSDFPEWQKMMNEYWEGYCLRYPRRAMISYESEVEEQNRLISSRPSEGSADLPEWKKMMNEYWEGYYLRHPDHKPPSVGGAYPSAPQSFKP